MSWVKCTWIIDETSFCFSPERKRQEQKDLHYLDLTQHTEKIIVYFQFLLLSSQLLQPLPLNPQPNPLLLLSRTNLLTKIKLQTRLIPIKTTPLQPLAIYFQHLPRQPLQQGYPIPPTPIRLLDKQILEVNARDAGPRTVIVKVQGHAGDGAVGVRDEQGLCVAGGEGGGVFGVFGVCVGEGAGEGVDGCFYGGG